MAVLVTRVGLSPRDAWDTPLSDIRAIFEALGDMQASTVDLSMFGI